MAVKLNREGWLQLFTQMRRPNSFLTRHFSVKPGGIYNGEKVAIDIQRFGEDVAIAIKKCTGPNLNDIDVFTTKEFTPPAYGEAFPLDVCELLNRMAGVDPYTAAYQDYAAALVTKVAQGFVLVNDKIVRAVELQASQILQTGELTLTDADGATVYTLDFKPKVAHFPTVSNDWDGASSTKLADLLALSNICRADGQIDMNQLIFGEYALTNFLQDDEVKAVLDNRRIEVGQVRPEFKDSGATFYGHIWIGAYRFEMWAYPGSYKDPQTGTVTKYLATDKVIMKSNLTRLDITAARVPLPLGPDPRVEGLLPDRLSSPEEGFDVTPNLYATPNGKQIMGELESRPLLIPVQIDGFGCLDTQT
jgi:hypothetical protein